MKKVYIKPDINIISTPELCQEPPIVGGSNKPTAGDYDKETGENPDLSKGHDSFFDWTDNDDSRSLWDD